MLKDVQMLPLFIIKNEKFYKKELAKYNGKNKSLIYMLIKEKFMIFQIVSCGRKVSIKFITVL